MSIGQLIALNWITKRICLGQIPKFCTVNSTDLKHRIIVDNSDSKLLIYGKVSRQITKEHLVSDSTIGCLCSFTTRIMKCNPNAGRGKKCCSRNSGYFITGVHPDQISASNRQYVFSAEVNAEEKAEF